MKNTKVLLGVLAMVLAFGMTMVGCPTEDDGDDSGTFTITDIPPEHINKMYIELQASDGNGAFFMGFKSVNSDNTLTFDKITGAKMNIPVYFFEGAKAIRYSGNDSLTVSVIVRTDEVGSFTSFPNTAIIATFTSVDFTQGNATKSWNDADSVSP